MALSSSTTLVSVGTSRDTALLDAGAIFTAVNPTPGTAISGHAAPTTFDQTKALLVVYNNGNLVIYPTALRLKLSNAGTGATTVRFEQVIDTGNRLSSGGTTLTANNGNYASNLKSSAIITFGAAVCTANTAASRQTSSGQYRDVIGVVRDQYGFVWGSGGSNLIQMAQTATNGTSELDLTIDYAPVAIGPGQSFLIHQWSASQSAAYQFEPVVFEYIEK